MVFKSKIVKELDKKPEQKVKIKGISLFKKQLEITQGIINSKARYITLNASRQFSKSTIAKQLLYYYSLNYPNSKILYVTPTYTLAKIIMNSINTELFESGVIKTFNKSDNMMSFISGSEIYFRSATNPDTIRGLSINYAFVDEAAFMSDDVWNVIRPTLAVIGEKCLLLSTPRGKTGFFYQHAQLGRTGDPQYDYFFGHYSENPFYNKDDVEAAKNVLPKNIFNQEYNAEFLDDGGSVFQGINDVQVMTTYKGNIHFESPWSIGIDLGRQSDFTVATVLNKDNEVVDVYRINQKDWSLIIRDLGSFLRKYPGSTILCETNSIGDVVYDLLRKSVPDILPFITTNDSKTEIIEELIYAIQTKNIKLPIKELYPELSQELETFTFQYSKSSRRIIYSALQGFHDDCVISLALAYKAKKKRGVGGFAFI